MKKDVISGIAMAIVFIAIPAQAGTRADAYTAMGRCDALSDNRAWLDCVYGAVQPVRAELGLPPALEAQQRLVPAAPRSLSTSESPALPRPAPSPGPNPIKNTGVLAYLLGGNLAVNRIPLSSYRFDGSGMFTVTLANGEVWQQMKDDDHLVRWKAPAARYVVSIRSMALGSYVLQVQGEPEAYKVKKIR
jgi:hypothetical protein